MENKKNSYDLQLSVKVTPKSSKNEVIGWENNELKIRLKALPEKGEANAELIKFISKILNIPCSHVELSAGNKSRHKRLKIKNITLEQLHEKISVFK